MNKTNYSQQLIDAAKDAVNTWKDSKIAKLKEELNHGKALPLTKDHLSLYLHLYGEKHKNKLLMGLSKIPDQLWNQSLTVTDYGCGIGLGSIVLAEIMQSKGINFRLISSVRLLESSCVALSAAKWHVSNIYQNSEIIEYNDTFENVEIVKSNLQTQNVLHIFSNVADMENFPIPTVADYLNGLKMNNVVVCVNPFYAENQRGARIDEFTA